MDTMTDELIELLKVDTTSSKEKDNADDKTNTTCLIGTIRTEFDNNNNPSYFIYNGGCWDPINISTQKLFNDYIRKLKAVIFFLVIISLACIACGLYFLMI